MPAQDYPHPTTPMASAVMRGNRKRDTRPELRLRSALHARGLRFRIARLIRIEETTLIRPDVVFGPPKVAVFVHGCFWHSCAEHGNRPGGRNRKYWAAKLGRNVERDIAQAATLSANGWLVLTVWEHEDPEIAAAEIAGVIKARKQAQTDRRRMPARGRQ